MQEACHVYIWHRCCHLLTVLLAAQFTDVNRGGRGWVADGGMVMAGVWFPVK